MRWCSGGRWFDTKRCYQRASRVANYLGQAILTRSNPLVCQLVVYRGKAQGRKQYTYAGTVAQGRRSRACAAREREPWLLATSLPVTRTLARQVVRLYRLRMSIEEGFRDMKSHQFGLKGLTYHRCASVERLQVLVFLPVWPCRTVVSGDGHYRTGRPLSIPGQQCAPQTHSFSVVRGLANGPGSPHHPYSIAAMKAAWSALRELPDAQPWAA